MTNLTALTSLVLLACGAFAPAAEAGQASPVAVPSPLSARLPRPLAAGLIVDDQIVDLPAPEGYRVINGSLAQLAGRIYAAYRLDPLQEQSGGCGQRIAMVELNSSFVACGKPQILETRLDLNVCPTAEDPRLVVHGDKLFVIYNSTADGRVYHSYREMFLAEIDLHEKAEEDKFVVVKRKRLAMANHERRLTEKNWTPFSHRGQLHFIYETNPPTIGLLSADDWAQPTATATLQQAVRSDERIAEPFGSMRGGTPAIEVPGMGFLSFYHTFMLVGRTANNPKYTALYMGGAYVFDAESPFAIKEILTLPLVPASAYQDVDLEVDSGKKLGWVTYPQGLIVDEQFAYVSYAQNDRRLRVLTIELAALRSLMREPSPASAITR